MTKSFWQKFDQKLEKFLAGPEKLGNLVIQKINFHIRLFKKPAFFKKKKSSLKEINLLKTKTHSLKKMRILTSLALAILILLAPLVYLISRHPPKAEAGWWDDTWHYRKSISITSGSSAGTDFQVKINDYNTSTDISAGKMQSDCGDIRFTSSAGIELPYWIETGCNTSTTDIWVKIDNIPSSGGITIYMYYGNPSAENGSDGDETFIFFDDFESGNLDKWEISGTSYGSWTAATDYAKEGNYSAKGQDTSTSGFPSLYKNITLTSFVVEQNVRFGETNLYHYPFWWHGQSGGDLYWGVASGTGYWQYHIGSGYTDYSPSTSYSSGTWYKQVVKFDPDASPNAKHYLSIDSTDFSAVDAKNRSGTLITGIDVIKIIPGAASESGGDLWIDNLFVRKFMATEPTVGSPSSEEKGTSPIAYWSFDEGHGTTVHNKMEKNGEKGLVAWWKFDEGSGSTAYDEMEINDATLGAGDSAPSWTTSGKIGNALDFDGTNDYVSVPDDSTWDTGSQLTVSAWIKPDDNCAGDAIAVHDLSSYKWLLYCTGTTKAGLDFYVRTASGVSHIGTSANDLNDGSWHYVVGVYDKSLSSNRLKMYIDGVYIDGTDGYNEDITAGDEGVYIGTYFNTIANGFPGKIDNVKVFNTALTPAQIAWEYNQGKPIAHWRFDEGQGSTAYDESDHNNDGSLGTGSSAPTWTTGKFNNALSFDGNDYVNCGTDSSLRFTSEPFTLSAWIYSTSTSSGAEIIANDDVSNGYGFLTIAGGTLRFTTRGTTDVYTDSSTTIPTNTWAHVVAIYTGSNGERKIYINGVEDASESITGSITAADDPLFIGQRADSSNYFQGKIDEVKVYNYALTAEQIKIDYNNSKAVRFK